MPEQAAAENVEPQGGQQGQQHRQWPPLFVYGSALILVPPMVLASVTSPSILTNQLADNPPLVLFTSVLVWSTCFLGACRLLASTLLLPELSWCLSAHSSVHCSTTAVRALHESSSSLRSNKVLLSGACEVAMAMSTGVLCSWIALSGDTPVGGFGPLAFCSNHLASILLLELLRPFAWGLGDALCDLALPSA